MKTKRAAIYLSEIAWKSLITALQIRSSLSEHSGVADA